MGLVGQYERMLLALDLATKQLILINEKLERIGDELQKANEIVR